MSINQNPKFYGRRKDKNHNDVADALREAGHYVWDTYRQGDGFPDILVVPRGFTEAVLMEIKLPGESLTSKEQQFWEDYPGTGYIVRSGEEAIECLILLARRGR